MTKASAESEKQDGIRGKWSNREPSAMRRRYIQVLSFFIYNFQLENFFTGTIYHGDLKAVCVPGLNCYSCPGAVGSCPIGSLQAVLGGRKNSISFYVTGLLMLFGAIFGRFVCGYICPFGLYQEALHKVPVKKLRVPKGLSWLRYLRYGFLVGLVILVPLLVLDPVGNGTPGFCAWVCPAGTLEAGIPLLLTQPALRAIVGWLFGWKMLVLVGLSALSMSLYRPFCRFICPLGLIYGWFNRISLHAITVDYDKCTRCGVCERVCKAQVAIYKDPGSADCVRCGDCVRACPEGAVSMGFQTGMQSGYREKLDIQELAPRRRGESRS